MRRTLCDQRMKSDGITRSQWWVLANLSRHGADGITNIELARLLDVGKVTLGRLITRLETSGYVYRRPDKYDRRAKHIFITNAGYGLIERMSLIMEGLNREISADLTAAETAAMENNLARMKDTLRGLLADVHGPDPEEQGD
jgi:DNA-binding MarR family transcriptional regulator